MPRGKKRTKQEIIAGIKEAWQKGVDLRVIAIQRVPYRWTYRYHKYYFESWEDALLAAGITYKQIQDRGREPKKQTLLAELKQAYENGVDLSASALQKKGNPNRSLYDRAKTHFKRKLFWEHILAEASLPVEQIVRQRRWTKEKIRQRLRARHQKRKPMHHAAVKDDEIDLEKACITHFDDYDAALEYAGFDPKRIRKTRKIKYSKLSIVLEVIRLNNQGVNLQRLKIMESGNKDHQSLVYAAQKRFDGRWPEAVETAGIDYSKLNKRKKRGYWTREIVIRKIQTLHGKGASLNAAFISIAHSDLHHAALRCIGSWDKALQAAGIDPKTVRLTGPSLTKEQIIDEIQRLHKAGQDLSYTGMCKQGTNETINLYIYSRNKFGSWENAITAAGLNYDDIRRQRGEYNLAELIAIVKNLHRQGVDLNASAIMQNPETVKYHTAVNKRFDSWYDILIEAGIDVTPYRKQQHWTKEKIVSALQEMYQSGIVFALGKKHRNLRGAAIEHFGSVNAAAQAAGFIAAPQGKIIKQMMKDPKVIGIVYKHNLDFLTRIANKVFYMARRANRSTLDRSDLISEAFLKMLEFLPKTPGKKGIRQFLYWRIVRALIDLNKKLFPEITFGEEVYLDIFSTDEDIWAT